MKKILKNVLLCILFISIGIFIGSYNKSLIKNIFNETNSSAESVVENFVQATYNKDKYTVKKCLSPDLNDIDKLKIFKAKGSNIASDILTIHEHYLYYKKNPPKGLSDEDMNTHELAMDKIEKGDLVEVYVEYLLNDVNAKAKDMEDVSTDDESIVIQNKEGKYYIVDMDM